MKIIALEGLDKSGKNTALKTIHEYLTDLGYKVETLSFPRYDTLIGQLIWDWLHGDLDVDHSTFELLQAADKDAAQSLIRQFEKDGVDYLIVDRYELSRKAYGSRYNDEDWIEQLGRYIRKPDFTIFLDVEPETSMSRKGEHGENDRYEKDLGQLKFASQAYRRFIQDLDHSRVIDANQEIDDVMRDVITIVSAIVSL